MKLESTSPSSSGTEQRIKALLSLEDQTFLFANDDKLQRYKAADHARAARMREARTAAREAVVLKAITDCLPYFWRKKPRERAGFLAGKIALALSRRGVGKDVDIRIIRRVVRKVEKNPDILIQSVPTD